MSGRRAFEVNEREIQRRLARHHLTLALGVTAVVDTRPPDCMYSSPKSIHYRPTLKTNTQSAENLLKSRERSMSKKPELTASSYNIYAASRRTLSGKSTGEQALNSSSSPYRRRLASIGSKLRQSACYQPPTRLKVSASIESMTMSPSTSGDSFVSSAHTFPSSSAFNAKESRPARTIAANAYAKETKELPTISSPSSLSTISSQPRNGLTRGEVNSKRSTSGRRKSVKWRQKYGENVDEEKRGPDDDPPGDGEKVVSDCESRAESGYGDDEPGDYSRARRRRDRRRASVSLNHEYQAFKESALKTILLRRIFTARVMEDCFRRQMRLHPELDVERMTRVMNESMRELGIRSSASSTTANNSNDNNSDNAKTADPLIVEHRRRVMPLPSTLKSGSFSRIESIHSPSDSRPNATDTLRRLPALAHGMSLSLDDSGSFSLDAPPPDGLFSTSFDDK